MVCLGKSPPVFWSPAIDQPHWSDWVPMTYDQPLTQVTMEFMARQFTHILEVENNNNDRVWLSGWPVDGRERERERAQAAKPGRPIAREPTAHYIQYNYRCTMGFKTPFWFFVFFYFFLTWDSFLFSSYQLPIPPGPAKLCLFPPRNCRPPPLLRHTLSILSDCCLPVYVQRATP